MAKSVALSVKVDVADVLDSTLELVVGENHPHEGDVVATRPLAS